MRFVPSPDHAIQTQQLIIFLAIRLQFLVVHFAHRLRIYYGEEIGVDGVLLEGGAKAD